MKLNGRTTLLVIGAAILGGAALGGCARHEEPYQARGSIKDTTPGTSAPQAPRTARGGPAQRVTARPVGAPTSAPDDNGPAGAPPRTASREAAPRAPSPNVGPGAPAAPATAAPTAADQPVGSPASPAEASPAADPPVSVNARLLEQGRQLFAAGKVLDARKRFISAINGLSPEATLALGRTFDTHYLSQLKSSDGAPDMQRALQLYQSAVERGSADAKADLDRTRATLGLAPL